jgi:Family of unknown function (DUF5678)
MMKRSNDNFEWLAKHYEELKEKHAGKYIAIDNGNVVAEDIDQMRLLEHLDKQFADTRAIVIQYIPKKDHVVLL